ncbi:MAG: hypothetical protein ISS33_02185 [Candidatus Omnitrophica bacterium]|nr:hypothetical protein [Candidatus Omnitrophota bacterium]
MKNHVKYILTSIFISSTLLAGCAQFPFTCLNLTPLAGFNVQDLRQAARENGREKVVSMPYETAFNKTLGILKAHSLTIYQSNMWGKYIVAMNFTKQVDTTRLGIFFEIIDDNKTKITLGSLSTSVVQTGEKIIFEGLK